jgi:integrase
VVYPLTAAGTQYLKPAAKWCADVRQADGTRQRVRLSANKAAAQVMLADLLKRIENEKAGLHTPFADHQKLPLAGLLADYRRHHRDKNNTAKQAEQAVRRCEKVFAGCDAVSLSDLDPDAVGRWLGEQRERPKGGISPQTHNHYVTALKAFGNWLVAARKSADNPFRFLGKLNVEVDIRRSRRPLSADEFARLLAAAAAGKSFRGVSGPDRVMLYTVASFTGLRASELASLTAASFALGATPPVVTVAAAYSKHRREDKVPLHPELVEQLRPWLAGFAPDVQLWPGKWAAQFTAGAMIRKDLDSARMVWVGEATADAERAERERSDFLAYRDREGNTADFHALRHTFITNLVKAGVQPKDAKELARHSTITLTMDRYAHVSLHDTAVAKLNAPRANAAAPDALPDALPGDGGGELVRAGDNPAGEGESREVPEISGRDGGCGEVRRVHPEGFDTPCGCPGNSGTSALQLFGRCKIRCSGRSGPALRVRGVPHSRTTGKVGGTSCR